MKSIIHTTIIIAILGLSFQIMAQDQVTGPAMEADSLNAVLNVNVVNEMGKVNAGDTITFTSAVTNQVYTGVTNEEGKFSIRIPNGQMYEAGYRDMSGKMQTSNIEIPANQIMVVNWELVFELPRVYTLDNVTFVTAKSTLRTASFTELNELVEVMEYKKLMKIEISGHTDDVGDDVYNQNLSEARAQAVRKYLIQKGIEGSRIIAIGYGETKPIAYNNTPEGRQKNRRTEVRILGRGPGQ